MKEEKSVVIPIGWVIWVLSLLSAPFFIQWGLWSIKLCNSHPWNGSGCEFSGFPQGFYPVIISIPALVVSFLVPLIFLFVQLSSKKKISIQHIVLLILSTITVIFVPYYILNAQF